MQICLAAAAEPSPPVDFLLTVSVPPLLSWASCPLCFCCAFPVLRCAVLPFLPTKQIKLFACASKSICVYQIVGLQTKKKQRKELKAESQTKTNKNKDYRFATAALHKKKCEVKSGSHAAFAID